jgi:hypothetical protein
VSDRDPAGSKERTDPQQFFGHKNVPFEANRQYVSVRDCFATDRLFPDEWIAEMHEQHSAWFDTFSLDAVDNSLASICPNDPSSGHALAMPQPKFPSSSASSISGSLAAVVPRERARRGRWVPHPIAAQNRSEGWVVGVVVAPDDVPADHAGLFFVGGVVGAVERAVAQGRELGLDAV